MKGSPHHRAEILARNAYLVQNHDKRVIFINPYEGDKALIGTTDIAYDGRAEMFRPMRPKSIIF